MLLSVLFLFIPLSLSLRTNSKTFTPRTEGNASADPLAIYYVSSFTAYHSTSSPDTSSYAYFDLTDIRPEHPLDTSCFISGSIYRPLFSQCADHDAAFQLSDGQLVVRRGWMMGQ
jgi:hypothetical protein